MVTAIWLLAALLAWPLFDEVPTARMIIGGVIALLGVFLGTVAPLSKRAVRA